MLISAVIFSSLVQSSSQAQSTFSPFNNNEPPVQPQSPSDISEFLSSNTTSFNSSSPRYLKSARILDDYARRELLTACPKAEPSVVNNDSWAESLGAEILLVGGALRMGTGVCTGAFLSTNPWNYAAVTYNSVPPTLYSAVIFAKHCLGEDTTKMLIAGREVKYIFGVDNSATFIGGDVAVGFIPVSERPADKPCLHVTSKTFSEEGTFDMTIAGVVSSDKACGAGNVYGHSTNDIVTATPNYLILDCSPKSAETEFGDSGGPWALYPPTYIEEDGFIKPHYELVGLTSMGIDGEASFSPVVNLDKLRDIFINSNGSTGEIPSTSEPMYFYADNNLPDEVMDAAEQGLKPHEALCGITDVDGCRANIHISILGYAAILLGSFAAFGMILHRAILCSEKNANKLRDEAARANPHPSDPANDGVVEIVVGNTAAAAA